MKLRGIVTLKSPETSVYSKGSLHHMKATFGQIVQNTGCFRTETQYRNWNKKCHSTFLSQAMSYRCNHIFSITFQETRRFDITIICNFHCRNLFRFDTEILSSSFFYSISFFSERKQALQRRHIYSLVHNCVGER